MIPVIHRASLSYLSRHPWQLALSVVGICIGVAVIVAVDIANESASKAFRLSMDAVTGKATHQIIGGPRGVDETLYTDLRLRHGYRKIAPVVEGPAIVKQVPVKLLGVDLFAEREMRDLLRSESSDLAEEGVSLLKGMLTEPGAVLMSQSTAGQLGIVKGQHFDLEVDGRNEPAFLLGTIGGEHMAGLANLIVTDIATAQAWLHQRGRLSRIDVRIDDADDGTRQGLEAILPADTRLLSAARRTRATAEMSAAFMTNLTAMSLLALLVGVFLIYNSVSFSVLQRRKLIGILRALGVSRGQTFGIILAEASVVGLSAAALGLLAGVGLGEQLLALVSQSINDFYYRVTVTEVTVTALSVGKGITAGLGATLVAAAVPALEASSYPPNLALTRSVLERRTSRLVPLVARAGVGIVMGAALLLALSGRNLIGGLVAVFMLLLGFALCMPLAARKLTSALAPLAGRIGGTPARMAVFGIGANLSRTGIAIVALAVALSATIGVSVMVDSFRGSLRAWLEQTLQADIYASAQGGTLAAGLAEKLVRMPGIEAYSTTRRVWIEDEAGRSRILAIRMAPKSYAGIEILDADPQSVWTEFDAGDAVLVSEPYAYRKRVSRGDHISLRTESGDTDFNVAATYKSYDINASIILMSRATYDRHWSDRGIDSIGLYLGGGADASRVMRQIESISDGQQRLRVDSNAGVRDRSLEIFDRTFIITDVLYWLAVSVAFIGILAAMLALQLERAQELAVLRALGMTPVQLGSLISAQTAVIGLLSGLAAIPLGIVMAWVLIEVINRRAFGWKIDMTINGGILLSAVLFAVVTAMLAGVYPAFRAARSRPAMAMREE